MDRGWMCSPGDLGQVYNARYRTLGTVSKNSGLRKGPEQS